MIERTAATRACSLSRRSRSVCGSSRRTSAAPSSEVARAATRSSTRGNSMTRNACAFTAASGREGYVYLKSLALRARSCSSRQFAQLLFRARSCSSRRFAQLLFRARSCSSRRFVQLLFRDGADHAALGSSLELRHHASHDRANIARSAGDRRAHGGAKLVVTHRGGQVRGKRLGLYPFLLGEVRATTLVVRLDRLATFLDPPSEHVDHVFVGEISPQLDLPIAHVGDDRAEEKSSRLVTAFASCIEVALQSRRECSHQAVRVRRFFLIAAFIFRFRRSLGFS